MNRLRGTKKIYDETPIPKELTDVVNEAIYASAQGSCPINSRSPFIAIFLSISTVFILLLNTSPTFAASLSDIPIISQLAKIFTISSYYHEDTVKLVDVKIPGLKDTGNTKLEHQINQEILEKINLSVAESEKRAQEYYDAFMATNTEGQEFLPVLVNVDYEIKYSDDHFVSFVITKSENYVSVGTEKYFYNIDLNTGKEVTLKDILGDQYKEIIDPQIKQQIVDREKDGYQLFFHEDENEFKSIADNQTFYINSSGDVVVVFDKYSIAPGYMGFPEFTIHSSSLPTTGR